jgi:hypothetical protein
MAISRIKWSPKGAKIILSDKNHSVIALPVYEFMSLAEQPRVLQTSTIGNSMFDQQPGFTGGIGTNNTTTRYLYA